MKKKTKHYFEYFLIKALYTCILILPEKAMNLIASFGAIVIRNGLHYRSAVIDKNLLIAFPEKSEAERAEIKHRFYTHFAKFSLEFIRAPKIDDAFIETRVIIETPHILDNLDGKPFIIQSGHFGDFSLLVRTCQYLIKRDVHIIMKEQRNPYANQFMVDQRLACNQIPIMSKGAIKSCMKALKNNEIIAFLNDQKADKKSGIMVHFFNEEARTMPGLALMKEKFDVPVFQGYTAREENGMYRFWMEEIQFDTKESIEDYHKEILQKTNDHLEHAIRKYPDQYLWSHKRWNVTY